MGLTGDIEREDEMRKRYWGASSIGNEFECATLRSFPVGFLYHELVVKFEIRPRVHNILSIVFQEDLLRKTPSKAIVNALQKRNRSKEQLVSRFPEALPSLSSW